MFVIARKITASNNLKWFSVLEPSLRAACVKGNMHMLHDNMVSNANTIPRDWVTGRLQRKEIRDKRGICPDPRAYFDPAEPCAYAKARQASLRTCLSGLPFTKNQRTYSHHVTSFSKGNPVITAHPHA